MLAAEKRTSNIMRIRFFILDLRFFICNFYAKLN